MRCVDLSFLSPVRLEEGCLTRRRGSAAAPCALHSHADQQHCLLYLKRHSRAHRGAAVPALLPTLKLSGPHRWPLSAATMRSPADKLIKKCDFHSGRGAVFAHASGLRGLYVLRWIDRPKVWVSLFRILQKAIIRPRFVLLCTFS